MRARLIITIRGGIIQHIASTTENIDVCIHDHDIDVKENYVLYEPDEIITMSEYYDRNDT